MPKIYFFNPENDLALAQGIAQYTAPPMARRLRHDLQLLPIWWASNDDAVWVEDDTDVSWLRQMASQLNLPTNILSSKELQNVGDSSFAAWGWSLATRGELLHKGVKPELLPSPELLAVQRELSHRRTSITIHQRISELLGYELAPFPVELSCADEVNRFIAKHGDVFLKAPWSSSGKGIYHYSPTFGSNQPIANWCNGILNKQKSIIGEVALNKVLDFAMEFHCEAGKATFYGYSIFYNDSQSSFDHGVVACESRLEAILAKELNGDLSEIFAIREALETILCELVAPHYSGFVGIDMLLYRNELGEIGINPCIEMNLRTTMGVATCAIGNHFIHHDSIGTFHIEFHKEPVDVAKHIDSLAKSHPATIVDGKIISGIIPLVPTTPQSRYCAYLRVKS